MKVVLILTLMVLAAAALANHNIVATSVTSVAVQVTGAAREPALLLLSGSVLLGVAGAVKRFTL